MVSVRKESDWWKTWRRFLKGRRGAGGGRETAMDGGEEVAKEEAAEDDKGPCLEKSPLETASWLSIISYSWVNPLMRKGQKKQLEQSDLFPIPYKYTTAFLGSRLASSWIPALKAAEQSGAPRPRIWKHALWPYRTEMACAFALMLVESGQRLSSSIVLRQLLLYLQGSGNQSIGRAYGLAIIFGALGVLYPVVHHFFFGWTNFMGWNLRVQAMALVNQKLLALSGGAVAQITTGHCINLMSNDVRRFEELFNYGPFIILGPMELLAVVVLIARELGVRATLAGVAALLALIPLQAIFAHFQSKQRTSTVKYTDQRVKMTGEVLNGILAVKMFAWEKPFTAAIEEVRTSERKYIERASRIKAFNEASFFSGAAIVSFITFAAFHAMGGQLQPFSVFYVLSLLQLPRLFMCVFFPMAVGIIAESHVSFTRMQRFLELPELNLKQSTNQHSPSVTMNGKHAAVSANGSSPSVLETSTEPSTGLPSAPIKGFSWNRSFDEREAAVRVVEGAFSWSAPIPAGYPKYLKNSEVPKKLEPSTADGRQEGEGEGEGEGEVCLEGISFDLGRRELLGVTGKVGSGKSSLLAAALGDLQVLRGSLQVNATRIAYAAQKPFIVAGSLRENIVFGAPFDAKRYKQVVDACALARDISLLPNGDDTEIGERGINLSGGQKARVGLARAAYAEADLLLLDDPLSAVDPAVGRHIFERCITGVMQGRACILVTHQLQYLPKCDRVLVLSDGKMADIGTFEELKERVDFHGFIELDDEDGEVVGKTAEGEAESGQMREVTEGTGGGETDSEKGMVRNKSIIGIVDELKTEEKEKSSTRGLVDAERREEGRVEWRVYGEYGASMGAAAVLSLAVLLPLGQAVLCLGDWFLAHWSRQSDQGGSWVFIYLGVVLAGVLLSFLRSGLFFHWALLASSRIHSNMLSSLLAAPLSFFHSNPIGRILNRFSADQGIMDDMLPVTLYNFLQLFFVCVGALVVVSIGVPWVAISFLPLLLVFLRIRKVFLNTSRELKRLEATTRSPVYAHYAAAIQGLSTIRAFGAEAQFNEEFKRRIDANGQCSFAWLSCNRWLAFRLDLLCAAVLLGVALLAVVARGHLSVTLVGLALTYTLQLAGSFQWTVRQSAEAENMFTGVERALEYTRLHAEGLRVVEGNRPPPEWPQRGEIVLSHLTVRYRSDLPPVLSDLCVTIQGGHKCGVIGRTGAGKSTLMLALFRLVEATEGSILIDDVNVASIGLEDLRRKVMAIPQDPVLFGNSLRFNIDPFSECADAELWSALEAVQLKQKADGLKLGLDSSMAEFGENFSIGERQLVCLARAILHHNRILVMDEATANVDLATDSLIQKTLREKFRECTVLIIAHRMDTIIDADKVLVLSQGRIVEFGTPRELLTDPEGAFTAIVRQTGAASEAMLRQKVQ